MLSPLTNASLKLGQYVTDNVLHKMHLSMSADTKKLNKDNKFSRSASKKIEQHHYIKNEANKSNARPLVVTQSYYLAIAALVLILFIIS